MKFVTEYELRALYKQKPFKTYALQEDERLTPSARQFLLDLGVDMYNKENVQTASVAKEVRENAAHDMNEDEAALSDDAKAWVYLKIKTIKPQFILVAQDVMAYDLRLAQQLTELGRQFSLLGLMVDGKCEVADLCCTPCQGINEANHSSVLDDCINITEFHLQLEKGRSILMLDQLKSQIQLFEKELEMAQWTQSNMDNVRSKLNQIVNRLSQLICLTIGGKECQRKM